MLKTVASPTILAALLALGLTSMPAQAQLARTFVSSAGNDANDCSRFAPCRTFQIAHDKTLASGEITVLDPGGYGAVIINKGISIINDGVGEAGVLVSGGNTGITINAGGFDVVSLRGLTVKGLGLNFGGGTGIVVNGNGFVSIENCVVRDMSGTGIVFQPNGTSSLAVSNTIAANNDNGMIVLPTGSGTVKAVFNRVELYGNRQGLAAVGAGAGTVDVTVTDSVASHNRDAGFFSTSIVAPTTLTVIRSVAFNNATGVASFNPRAMLRIT